MRTLILPPILLGLSMIGIILGWISWDRTGGKPSLSLDAVHLIEYLMTFGAIVLATLSVWLFAGSSDPLLAIGCGMGAGLYVYGLARLELR